MAMKEHCAFPPKGYRGRTTYEGEKKISKKFKYQGCKIIHAQYRQCQVDTLTCFSF